MAAKFDPASVLDDFSPSKNGRRRRFPPDVAADRKREATRRGNDTRYMAYKALAGLHAEDYEALMKEARRRIDAAAGPLPGDN